MRYNALVGLTKGKIDPVELGARIKEERLKRGWSLRALAERAGVNFAYIDRIEKGKAKRIGADVLRKLAGGFGWSEAEIQGTTTAQGKDVDDMHRRVLRDVEVLSAVIEDVPELIHRWAELPPSVAMVVVNTIDQLYSVAWPKRASALRLDKQETRHSEHRPETPN